MDVSARLEEAREGGLEEAGSHGSDGRRLQVWQRIGHSLMQW